MSLTELSEYGATEDDERARLRDEEAVTDPTEMAARLTVWSERMAHYRENRIHPRLPLKRTICFYPMSKRRAADANWYELDFDARKQLMAGHARVGRTYAGRVLQLITGSTGLDDWEWGVTLLADDPVALKEIVYEMRFDPVSVALRRVRSVRDRPGARAGRGARPGRAARLTGPPARAREASATVDEAQATARMREAATGIVAGVEAALPGWVEREVERIVDAWGRLDEAQRAEATAAAGTAGRSATQRVVAGLRDLFGRDPVEHTATPLQIVRSAYREPTAVLAAVGIPPVERDEFHERAWPDDDYGLVPESLADLGDEDLGPLLLAWGLAKAAVLRARAGDPGAGNLSGTM